MTAVATRPRPLVLPSRFDIETEQLRRSLKRFVCWAWPILLPGVPFVDGAHLDVLVAELEKVARREERALLFNVPPRHTKSTIVNVLFPAWRWASNPEHRFLFASYNLSLAVRDNVARRRLIEHPAYQQRWPRVVLVRDVNQKMRFENTLGGTMLVTSVGGGTTGEGGDTRILDDPNSADDATSEVRRETATDWLDQVWASRQNDPATSCEIVIQQRIHEDDITGHLLRKGGFRHVCLPAEYDPGHKHVSDVDPRSEPGALLWPDRFGPAELAKKKVELGSYAYAGQYQQLPAPAEGGIWKRDWWQRYTVLPCDDSQRGRPKPDAVIGSWDMTFKAKKDSDYVVGQVWHRYGADLYLVEQTRARLEFTEARDAVIAQAARAVERGQPLRVILIEDTANGPAILQTLRSVVSGIVGVTPVDSKEARAHAVSAMIEAGQVHVPDPALHPWVGDFVDECASFPNGSHDDQVDAASQALERLRVSKVESMKASPFQ